MSVLHAMAECVLLSGELNVYATIAGTMSGGGGRVMKGKMSSTIIQEVDENSMKNLEKQLEKVQIVFVR